VLPLFRLLAAALALVSLQCGAAPFAIQLGETRIALDAPPGFADTGFTGSPRLQDIAEGLTSASNRILVFAISDADLRRFMVGDQMDLKRYMLIATPKGSERESLSAGGFARLAGDSLRALGAAPAADADYQKYLDAQPQGRASLLAELVKEQSVLAVLQGSRLPPVRRGEPAAYQLSSTTLMLVRGKALNLTVYGAYESAADVEWIRAITVRWIEDLKRLNAR
jgi:hypothetical protein